MKKFVLAAVFALAAGPLASAPALAQECTEEAAEGLSQELFNIVEEKGTPEEQLEQYVAEVEAHYGGEPTPEQTCEALGMLIDKVAAE